VQKNRGPRYIPPLVALWRQEAHAVLRHRCDRFHRHGASSRSLLARRGSTVQVLMRESSRDKLPALLEPSGASARRVACIPVWGDIDAASELGLDGGRPAEGAQGPGRPRLSSGRGLRPGGRRSIARCAQHVHGTRHFVQFAQAVHAGHAHHVSSIAAAGLYEGVFREDMFDEAGPLDHPYFMHQARVREASLRQECRRPWTVYRPAMVVGDSQTGEMDKIDGPYYFFKPIQRLRQILPPWFPSVGLEGGRVNIVPVDFVVNALDHISASRWTGWRRLLPPGGPQGLPRRRRARHLRKRRPRAQDEPVR
jgi:hypothetical protein